MRVIINTAITVLTPDNGKPEKDLAELYIVT